MFIEQLQNSCLAPVSSSSCSFGRLWNSSGNLNDRNETKDFKRDLFCWGVLNDSSKQWIVQCERGVAQQLWVQISAHLNLFGL